MKPIVEIADKLRLKDDDLELYGKYKAKISLDVWERLKDKPNVLNEIYPKPKRKKKGEALSRKG